MVKYEWLFPAKKQAICATTTLLLAGQEVHPDTVDELISEQYLRDYIINKDTI